jgi:hypothetical protein
VDDATLAFEDPDPLQLALLGAEALEQPPPLAEQQLDQVDLELVEEAGGQGALGDPRPGGGRVAAEDPDGYAVVMVASPAAGGLEGAKSGDDGSALGTREGPLVQPVASVPEPVLEALVGPAMNPSRVMDMYSTVEDIDSLLWGRASAVAGANSATNGLVGSRHSREVRRRCDYVSEWS